MPNKLYVVNGSHPCEAVARAMDMKGISYKTVELPPPFHALIQRMLFGERTVPAIKFEDGEKLSGSRAIMRRLDEMAPDPALYPRDPDQRAKVEEAERWGDEEFQPIGRRLLWPAMKVSPDSITTFLEGSKLPLPAPVARLNAPVIARAQLRLNRANDDTLAPDLAALPGQLDRIDGYIADGVIGGDKPNAADLQIASTVRLLLTIDDLKPLIEPRPAGKLALKLWPTRPGRIPVGALPAELVPAPV